MIQLLMLASHGRGTMVNSTAAKPVLVLFALFFRVRDIRIRYKCPPWRRINGVK